MIKQFEKETGGVLFLCSKKGLKKYFQDNEFNRNFPDGILPLINKGIGLAITTESGEDVTGEVMIMESMNDKKKYKLACENKFFVEEDDEIFILAHNEFTHLCSVNKGDIDSFNFWDEKISVDGLRAGWYFAFVHYKISKKMPYLDIIFQLTYSAIEPPHEDVLHIPAV